MHIDYNLILSSSWNKIFISTKHHHSVFNHLSSLLFHTMTMILNQGDFFLWFLCCESVLCPSAGTTPWRLTASARRSSWSGALGLWLFDTGGPSIKADLFGRSWCDHGNIIGIYIYIYIFIYDLSIWLGLPFPVIKCGKLEIPELAMEVCGWEIHWTTLWIFQHVAFDSWRVSMDLSWIDDQCISTTMFGHGKSVTHRTYMI